MEVIGQDMEVKGQLPHASSEWTMKCLCSIESVMRPQWSLHSKTINVVEKCSQYSGACIARPLILLSQTSILRCGTRSEIHSSLVDSEGILYSLLYAEASKDPSA